MRNKVEYSVTADGMIIHAAARMAEASAQLDPIFGGPLDCADLIGRNLFHFIEGAEVRHLYGMFHERVLEANRRIVFDYRCDGPYVRRDMRMSLSRGGELVRYESVTLKETRRAVPIPSPVPEALMFVSVCSMCKKYRFPRDSTEWKEIELMLSERNFPESFRFSHGLCDECLARCMAEVN